MRTTTITISIVLSTVNYGVSFQQHAAMSSSPSARIQPGPPPRRPATTTIRLHMATTSTLIQEGKLYVPTLEKTVSKTKQELLQLIETEPDDTVSNHARFQPLVNQLKQMYASDGMDARFSINPQYNGDWQNLHAPAFKGRLGFSNEGDPLYTIGTLTFEQFPHINKVLCRVEKMTQSAHYVNEQNTCPPDMVPLHLQELVKANPYAVRSSVLDTHFTTVSEVRGIFRMQSYLFPHPTKPNRFETWFVGGKCLSQPDQDVMEWNKVFAKQPLPQQESESNNPKEEEQEKAPPPPPPPKTTTTQAALSKRQRLVQFVRRSLRKIWSNDDKDTQKEDNEKGNTSVCNVSYDFPKPISAHQTVIYLDDDLRITIGSRNTLIIVSRQ